MKTIKTFITIIFIFTIYNVNSQSQKITELEKNRVRLFSMEEFFNLSLWFYNELNEMKLTEDLENKYTSIFAMYTTRMSRLDDTDKGFTKEEIITKFKDLEGNLNNDINKILNQEQYSKHSEIMKVLSRAVLNKLEVKE